MNDKVISLEATFKQCLMVAERICSGREFKMEGPATLSHQTCFWFSVIRTIRGTELAL